jgi:hypothetical protein
MPFGKKRQQVKSLSNNKHPSVGRKIDQYPPQLAAFNRWRARLIAPFDLNESNNLVSVIDANGNTSSFTYDAEGHNPPSTN